MNRYSPIAIQKTALLTGGFTLPLIVGHTGLEPV